MPKRARSDRPTGIGCGYMLQMTAVISALMLANSFVVGQAIGMFMQANRGRIPDIFDDVRVYQFFQIFGPILLVAIQFWIFDRLMYRLKPEQQ